MRPKNMRKRIMLLSILVILALLVASIIGVMIWQRENLKALQTATQFTPVEIEEKLDSNQKVIEEVVASVPNLTVRDLSEEEKKDLQSGELPQQVLVDKLTEEVNEDQSAYEKELSELLAEVYILRETFTQKLDALQATAIEDYRSLPASQKTASGKVKWAAGYIAMANDLEHECDAAIDKIAVELQKLIEENNGDESLVNTVVSTYANEKSLKKSWYISELKERGFI